jgi:hypothetical protein
MTNVGRIGIGTASPSYLLDIINTVASSNSPFLRLGGAGGAGNQVGIILNPLNGRTGGPSSQIIAIDENSSSHLTFWTAASGTGTTSTERMRITTAGNVGIGKTNPGVALDVVGAITASGDITSSSDRRVKSDIKNIEGALDKVTQIGGYTFTRTDEPHKGHRQAGVIAQEIIEVLPEVVQISEETGYYSVSYGNITALLIEALKEERIERLKLEERLARLEA